MLNNLSSFLLFLSFFYLKDIPHNLLELLPLFSRMITETGTASLDSVALSRKIGAETGGIYAGFHTDIK